VNGSFVYGDDMVNYPRVQGKAAEQRKIYAATVT